MRDEGKHNVLGVQVDAVDYEAAIDRILQAAKQGRGYSVSALAVHGVMTGVEDPEHRHRLNSFDLVTPDGQPVRWALNRLYRLSLEDRVYGPTLTRKLCGPVTKEGIPIYLYGSRQEVLDRMVASLRDTYPGIVIAGAEPSKFRRTDAQEKQEIAQRIRDSGAKITFVGLGCPRQEIFAFEYRDALSMPVIAVGAAFDYIAGMVKEPPMWVQKYGLQWLYRLLQDPKRLWKRYVVLNTRYMALLALQLLKVWRPDTRNTRRPSQEILYG